MLTHRLKINATYTEKLIAVEFRMTWQHVKYRYLFKHLKLMNQRMQEK